MNANQNLAKVCDTCQKRLSVRNRAVNGIQCLFCYTDAPAPRTGAHAACSHPATKAARAACRRTARKASLPDTY